eukprot:UN08639
MSANLDLKDTMINSRLHSLDICQYVHMEIQITQRELYSNDQFIHS